MSATALDKHYPIDHGDYVRAGEASADIKRALRQLGVSMEVLRRVSVAAYEAEMNMVIHGQGGTLALEIDFEYIQLVAEDNGPGIPNLQLAMQEGYSTAGDEIREIGFGAGMGLPNINRCVDFLGIQNKPQGGTIVTMQVSLGAEK